jgi:hypothetical protein
MVVGPVVNYAAKDGESPLGRILANWQIEIPVIDVAIKARARRDWATLLFPFDGHLTRSGHAYIAQEAARRLQAIIGETGSTTASSRAR